MAHKNQHIVPRCYLKNFVSPKNNTSNPHHKNGIFVNNKSLKEKWKEKGLDNPIFTHSYFYSLQVADENDRLVVEKYLSKIEHFYDQTLNNIKKGEITENDITIFKIFLYFQFIRAPSFMSMMQKSFSQVAKCVDDFSGNNDATEEVIDLSKKLIIGGISEDNVILNQASLIFSNNTGQAFLTSDNPVVRKIINWRQASNLIGKDFLISTYDNSIEKPLFYMPISSDLGLLSPVIL
ncbi:DUF4238 domain-containing protein [Legionella genomosp. 1]|uniref:DUF4238 domain-containing protein n=1 Tax=Legionella genomosp. 1 TaxID=1093625 RepID=UPI0010560791|nr:DUF4238 domain-containing protein [Legionella genomosp. 1]